MPTGKVSSASAVQFEPQYSTRPGLFGAMGATTTVTFPVNESSMPSLTSFLPLKTRFRLLRSRKMKRMEKRENPSH